jgi:protein-disulfide isomerase/DNA-binding XRE family transcriptional regulator
LQSGVPLGTLQPMTDAELVAGTRVKLKMSQTDLAERLGVSPSAVSRWEAGARGLPGPARKLLAQMMGEEPPAPGGITATRKNIISGLAALIVAGMGASYFAFGHPLRPVIQLAPPGVFTVEIKPTDIVYGQASAPVTLLEYGSMTCPRCARFQTDVLPQFTKAYVDTGKVKLIFREFPFDAAARLAAALARCQKGDAFYAFIDFLFRNQNKWLDGLFASGQQPTLDEIKDRLAGMGKIAGISHDRAIDCMNDPANLAIVDGNANEAETRYRVSGTPTIFVGSATLSGQISYGDLKKLVDPLLVKG